MFTTMVPNSPSASGDFGRDCGQSRADSIQSGGKINHFGLVQIDRLRVYSPD